MLVLTTQVGGLNELQVKLGLIGKAFDITSVLDEAEALILNRIRARFLAEEDPDGNKWVPSKAGAARRAAGGTGTLFDTGTLFHSIQAHKTGADERAISTDVDYAPKHQLGLEGMKKREFLGFGGDDDLMVERLIVRRLQGVLG